MTKELPTPDVLRKMLRYDPDTGRLFWRTRSPDMFTDGSHTAEHTCAAWNARFASQEAFTILDTYGYLTGRIVGRTMRAHRVAWALHHGRWPADQIDHINGDAADNRAMNLREVSNRDNNRNRSLPSNNTSGAPGVCWHKRDKKWQAQIEGDAGHKYLGLFAKRSDAIAAVNAARDDLGYHPNHGRAARSAEAQAG